MAIYASLLQLWEQQMAGINLSAEEIAQAESKAPL
jgi:hypothetical protein